MHFLALATDYDGTLAHDGFVAPETCEALRRLKESGRRLILVTGRELVPLKAAFADFALFDLIIAENGAVLYEPRNGTETTLAEPPPHALVERLLERHVEPISIGRVILATWEPHEREVLAAIHELGLELQITFNKGAVMVLPPGVNKASGLRAALRHLDISAPNVVAVGDAENDHAFLGACGCSAAVANALPALRNAADIRLTRDHGAGVVELIDAILCQDAHILPPARRGLRIGNDADGEDIYIEADTRVLIGGDSGIGKSRFAKLLSERMVERGLEFCVIDPEGDYEDLDHAVQIGSLATPPLPGEALRLLHAADLNVVINAVALTLTERRQLFADLLPAITELHRHTGRPHWLIIDEAHHILPAGHENVHKLPESIPATVMITVSPRSLAHQAVAAAETILAFGKTAPEVIEIVAAIQGRDVAPPVACGENEALCWFVGEKVPRRIKIDLPQQLHHRHSGKYAVGDVGVEHSFYFRGARGSISLCAHNLSSFLELGYQVDDETWEYHLRAGDYSAWFRHVIKDEALARECEAISFDRSLSPQESRRRIREAVGRRYIATI
ncbi:HAD superfamily hydrolase (TIGR01484 family) [Rhodopseudomonas julia]|uniref:HAD superfamily hydrolase (TIGR01484 family) n=1 Tax=Rhodopseudomonas julia TaxID=200617 RepID=A0ABU0C9C7_9BRAD|nr:HAD-IIB family hydrolase [Rhodopseudomonas julia]MDQ0327138.1 HAD superfamily hydrolase (TIGR01484 family) [Rhodopseudomonas julia]